jgi:hypothetical protein
MLFSADVNQGQNESREFSIRRRALLFGNMEGHEYGDCAVIMDGCEVSPYIVAFS